MRDSQTQNTVLLDWAAEFYQVNNTNRGINNTEIFEHWPLPIVQNMSHSVFYSVPVHQVKKAQCSWLVVAVRNHQGLEKHCEHVEWQRVTELPLLEQEEEPRLKTEQAEEEEESILFLLQHSSTRASHQPDVVKVLFLDTNLHKHWNTFL